MKNKLTQIFTLGLALLLIGGVATAGITGKDLMFITAGETLGKLAFDEVKSELDGEMMLSASAGPDHYVHNRFLENISIGGGHTYATSSTAASYTLTTTELDVNRRNSYISWTVNVNTTLTTMASSSAPLVGLDVGESYSVWFYNASTTAAATATFAAGTGVDLQEGEGETVICNGLELCKLTFLKKSDTDVILLVNPMQTGD